MVDGYDITAAIREPKVSQGASLVATLRPVRQWVLGRLRQLAEPGGVIAEGRDMGTRVFPEAEVKIFIEASLQVRAHRRWLELQTQGRLSTKPSSARIWPSGTNEIESGRRTPSGFLRAHIALIAPRMT